MNHQPNQPRYQPRTHAQQERDRTSHGRRGDSAARPAENKGELTLEQHAGAVARAIIKTNELEDTTVIWRALKRAYLTGFEDAQR